MPLYFRIDGDRREPAALPLVVYGNGPQARVIWSFVSRHAEVAGFTVDDELVASGNGILEGLPVVPLSEVARRFPPGRHAAMVAVGYSDMNGLRQRKADALSAIGYRLASYVDPTVQLPARISIGSNCAILDHVSLHTGTAIGDGTFVSSGAVIGHDCAVGPYCWIGSGCVFAGCVKAGERSFFGLKACVAQRVNIGECCFVGSQALVANDLAARSAMVAKNSDILPIDGAAFMALTAK